MPHSPPDIRREPNPHCVVCGRTGVELYTGLSDYLAGTPGQWRMVRCPDAQCGTLWLDPRPVEDDLVKAYATYHTHGHRRARRLAPLALSALNATCKLLARLHDLGTGLARQRRALRTMFVGDARPGALLEVGSGKGRFLARMRDAGWSVQGTDIDPVVAARIQERHNLRIDVGELHRLGYPADRFDVVAMSQVIEHAYDPLRLLEESRRVLRPGGRLLLSTPNAASLAHRTYGRWWRGLEPPRHLQIFTPASLRGCVERSGLRVLSVQTVSAESAGIYQASDELRRRHEPGSHAGPAASIVRSWVRRHAEFRRTLREPFSGQDIFLIAAK